MNNYVVKLENLTKKFKSGDEIITVLDDLSISFKRGSKIIVTGDSGSGKSTMLNLIAGLESPTSGIISAGDYRLDKMSETQLASFRKEYVGLVFQFHYLLKDFNALENIMLPARMCGVPYLKAKKDAIELIESVGLKDRFKHYPMQLSGGERQRVAVARALINKPDILLADEPTGNLDEQNSAIIEELLFSIVAEFNTTLILVTHDKTLSSHGDIHYHLKHGVLESV